MSEVPFDPVPGSGPTREGWLPFCLLAGAWLLLGTLEAAWLWLNPWPSGLPTLILDDGLVILMAAGASAGARWRSRNCPPELARSWRSLHWTLLAFAVSMAYTLVVVELLEAQGALRALRHAGYIAGFLLLIRFLLLWPVRRRFASQGLQTLLDGLAIALAGFLLAWPLFLEAWVMGATQARSSGFLGYPLLATVTGVAWIFQESRMPVVSSLPSARLIRFGLLIFLVFYSLYGFLSVRGAYAVRGRAELMDLVWSLSFLALGLAALYPRPAGTSGRPLVVPRRTWVAGPFLPGAAALGSGFVQAAIGRALDGPQLWMALGLATALIMRLFLSLRDLEGLSRTLEERIAERTEALRQSQQELIRGQRMQMISTMSAGLAHDFKNLLAVIQSCSDVIELEQPAGQHVSRGLQGIRAATSRASELVRQLLTLGHQRPPQPHWFELGDFLRNRQPLLEGALGKEIRLVLDLPEESLHVVMDPDQLEEVLLNLAGNARDALDGGGTFRLGAAQDPVEPWVLLVAEDNGPGIPPPYLDRIFDPFFSSKPKSKGTGLGLSTALAVMVQSGGGLRAENVPGGGARFVLRVPQRALPAADSA